MDTLIEPVAWVLIHSLWQAAIIAAGLGVALQCMRTVSAHVRYLAAGCAMVVLLAGTFVSGAWQWQIAQRGSARLSNTNVVEAARRTSVVAAAPPATPKLPAKDSESATEVSGLQATPGDAGTTAIRSSVMARPAPILTRVQDALRPSLPWIVALWATGVTAMSLRLLRSWRTVRRLRASAVLPCNSAVEEIMDKLAACLQVRQRVRLLATSSEVVPMVIGWIKPVIVVPASLFVRLPAEQVEAIIAHELAHIRRQDYLVNLLQKVVEILFFYHPAVWWISAQLRREREHCCDDMAAATCGGALNYARALTSLEELRGGSRCYPLATAVTATDGFLLRRVQRLLGVPTREPCAAVCWPAAVLSTLFLMSLFVGPQLVQGSQDPPDVVDDAPVRLTGAPSHGMATALLNRWQQLEDVESPIPESRVKGLRLAIDQWLAESNPTATEAAELVRFRQWHADRKEHPAAELMHLLNAIAAVRVEPVQLAFNNEPWPGRVLPQAELDALAFGPAAANGLRAAWSLGPQKATYVLGDQTAGYLTLWNTGVETLHIGIGLGPDHPGLRPPIAFTALGDEGRTVDVGSQPADPVKFTAKWRLKAGEAAVIGGYRLKIGRGEEREFISAAKHSTSYEMLDLYSGEQVSLTAHLPYPKLPNDGKAYAPMQTGAVRFNVIAPSDVEVWTTTRSGTWPLAGGVTLEVTGEVYHGADVLTKAVLRWPAQDGAPTVQTTIDVAAGAFGNQQPWAIAWESDKPVLWIASGDLRSWRDYDKPADADNVKRVEFRDPQRIVVTSFSGWPQLDAPSVECMRAMDDLISVPPQGVLWHQYIRWATANRAERYTDSMLTIYVYLEENNGHCRIGDDASHRLEDLPDVLRAEAAKKKAQWQRWTSRIAPSQRGSMDADPVPHAVVVANASIPQEVIERVINACQAAGVGPDDVAAESAPARDR